MGRSVWDLPLTRTSSICRRPRSPAPTSCSAAPRPSSPVATAVCSLIFVVCPPPPTHLLSQLGHLAANCLHGDPAIGKLFSTTSHLPVSSPHHLPTASFDIDERRESYSFQNSIPYPPSATVLTSADAQSSPHLVISQVRQTRERAK